MFIINYIFEFCPLLIGLTFYKKIRPPFYRLILLVLLITVINEGCSHFDVYHTLRIPISFFYNIFFLFQLVVFFIIFFLSLDRKLYKKIAVIIFISSLILSLYFLNHIGWTEFNPLFIDSVSGCLISLGFLYFISIYQKEVHLLKTDSLFWFSTGVIIVNFFLLLFVNAVLIDAFRNDPNSIFIFKILNTVGNFVYYSCLTISVLCSSQLRNQDGIL